MNSLSTTHEEPRLTRIYAYNSGWWQCLCGNEAEDSGFWACNEAGEEVEPTTKDWKTGCYLCGRCGRIIHAETFRVVDYAKDATVSEEERRKVAAELEKYGDPRPSSQQW